MLDENNRLPFNYLPKTEYDTLIQNVTPKQMLNLKATTIVEIDEETRMKIGRIKNLESIFL